MEVLDKAELLRLKEIVEWQINIAREQAIKVKRENELKDINLQLKKLENGD